MVPKAVVFSCSKQVRVIRRSLPSYVLRTLLQAFTCRLDYCNLLLVRLPACDFSCLQSVQNVAGRLFGGVSRYDSVEYVLSDKLDIGCQSCIELNSRSGCLDRRLSMALHVAWTISFALRNTSPLDSSGLTGRGKWKWSAYTTSLREDLH